MEKILKHEFNLLKNPKLVRPGAYSGLGRQEVLSLAALSSARGEIVTWQGYRKTPLRSLAGLAEAAGVSSILYKDEGSRFGLGSFKALGGAYAVAAVLQREVEQLTNSRPSTHTLASGSLKPTTSKITVTCATDGNHGKSVAWGAQTFGCRCIIYVHAGVSQGRRDAIAAYGAEVREVAGTYDEAVRQAALDAATNDWRVISDTSYEGYLDVPRYVMQGYGLIIDEAISQYPDGVVPTHCFVQGGVGGLAAGICSYLWERYGAKAPKFFVAEPTTARCLYLSAEAGCPTADHGSLDTIMAGLACGEVSLLAWSILDQGADGFLTVPDAAAADTMRLLADSPYNDAPVVAGESAVAGLAAFLLAAADPAARATVGINESSVILVIGTEGATDTAVYRSIVGRGPEEVDANWQSASC